MCDLEACGGGEAQLDPGAGFHVRHPRRTAVVRFRVEVENAAQFISDRQSADASLAQFDGFIGSELAQIDATHWVLIVHWLTPAAAAAAQRVTLSSASPVALQEWIALAAEVSSFETANVMHSGTATTELETSNLAVAEAFVSEILGKAPRVCSIPPLRSEDGK